MARTKQSERKTIKAIKKEKETKPVKNESLIKEKKEKKNEKDFQKQIQMKSLNHIIDSTNLISLNDKVLPSEPALLESSNVEIQLTCTKEEKKEKYLWGCQLD